MSIISKFPTCSCLAVGYSMLHTIFYEILETNMVFFADSKYVNFNNNTLCFLFFSYLSYVNTPQLKKHTVSVSSISLSFLNHLKKIVWCTKEHWPLHAIKNPFSNNCINTFKRCTHNWHTVFEVWSLSYIYILEK